MYFWIFTVFSFCFSLDYNVIVGQLVQAAYRRKRQFRFWQAFHALRWPTDLVSSGQVEAIEKNLYFVACPFLINRK